MDSRATPMAAKDKLAALLRAADIEIDGSDPWDLRVHDDRFYARVLAHGTLGAGESYMDGWWDVAALDEFFARVHRARLDRRLVTAGMLAQVVLSKDRQSAGAQAFETRRAAALRPLERSVRRDARPRPCSTPAPTTAPTARIGRSTRRSDRKLDLIARKLHLQPGMTVLELGGGFGGLARHLAKHHRCRVVSYNISREQVEFARAWCDGLPVEFRLAGLPRGRVGSSARTTGSSASA